MWQTGDVVGRKVVIFRASAACKTQSVLTVDGYEKRMEVLYNQPYHEATIAMETIFMFRLVYV